MIKVVLAGAALAAVLAGCGATASSGPPDLSEQHFHDCIAQGGSYSQTDDQAWSCVLPSDAPTPTDTPS